MSGGVAGRTASPLVRIVAVLQRERRPDRRGPVARWLLTRLGRAPERFARTTDCAQCGDDAGVRVLRLGPRRARYWCEHCDAVVSLDDVTVLRPLGKPAGPARPRPGARISPGDVMPAAMLAWAGPLDDRSLQKRALFALYDRWDAET